MYQVSIQNGYIVSLSSGVSEGNIEEDEYEEILSIIRNKPTPQEGYDYRLKSDKTWELYKLPEEDSTDEELTPEELVEILLGNE